MSCHRAARNRACVFLATLFACGPTVEEPLAEDWHVGEWFIQEVPCTEFCKAEILVQLEIEPDGDARIYRESNCQIETEDALTWTEEEVGSLRFEPVTPGADGLWKSGVEFFRLRHVDDCSVIAEEAGNEIPLRRGPVTLRWGELGDCIGPIVPDGEPPSEACLYAE